MPEAPSHGLRSGGHAHLLVRVSDIGLKRVRSDPQIVGDRVIPETLGYAGEHLHFAPAETKFVAPRRRSLATLLSSDLKVVRRPALVTSPVATTTRRTVPLDISHASKSGRRARHLKGWTRWRPCFTPLPASTIGFDVGPDA